MSDVIQNDSKYRVAFDLMQQIASYENNVSDQEKTREYWIKLYAQSLSVVISGDPARALGKGG